MAYSERTINWSNAFFRAETKKFLKYGLVGIIVVFGFFGPVNFDFSYSHAMAENHEGSSLDVGAADDAARADAGSETSITVKKTDPTGGTRTLKDSAQAYTKSSGKTAASPSTGLVTIAMTSLANLLLTIVSRLLWIAGIFFNYSMNFTLNLAAYIDTARGGLDINSAWVVVRDLVNITFIFSLLWIAATTILELGDHKKFLTGLIIAALLINFSLFFTKVIIDISNTIALQFYSSITAGQFNNPNADLDGGISGQFMERLKLQTIYAIGGKGGDVAAELRSQGPQLLSMTSVFMVTIFGSIFFLVAAAVFFSAALMFVARSAMLILLMVTSPIGFIGGWIPKLKTYADMWWEQLWSQSMLAPVFLMLIWVILKMTEPRTIGGAAATSGGSSPNTAAALTAAAGDSLVNNSGSAMASAVGTKSTVSFATALSGSDGSSAAIIFNFFMLLAFLVAALTVAKKLSGQAGKVGAKMFGTVAGGVGGFLGRHTVGRLASKIGRMEGFRDAAAKSPRTMGRLLKGVEGVAGSSFDVRGGIPGIRTVGGTILGATGAGLELGKAGGEGGYQKTLQKQVEGKEKSAQELGVNKEKILEQDRTITRHQGTISTIKRGAATASRELNPAEKARVDTLEGQIKTAKAEKQRIARERKTDMATGIDTRSPETLWAKVARKDKVAAAHIQIEVRKKENEEEEKEISEIKPDIKALEKRLREASPTTLFTPSERAELDKLRKKLLDKEENVRNKKLEISELETIS
mgnify:FL=1